MIMLQSNPWFYVFRIHKKKKMLTIQISNEMFILYKGIEEGSATFLRLQTFIYQLFIENRTKN